MTTAQRSLLAAAVAIAAVGLATFADADGPVACDDPGFLVDAPDASTHGMICAVASESRAALDICGLSQSKPITIEIVDEPIHHVGECLASFDCELARIRIIDRDLLEDYVQPGDAYAGFPADVVFRSLLTHEMAHALVDQASGDQRIAPVDQEFIANALEVAALAPLHRKAFLDAAGVEPPVSADAINILIYGLAPRRFSAASYLYFDAHGCDTVSDILGGTASFHVEL